MKKAVFFDFDGVICDSEMLHVQIALDFYKKENIHVFPEEIYRSIGGNRRMNNLLKVYNDHIDEIPYDYDTFRERKSIHREKYKDFNYGTIVFKNVKKTLCTLKDKGIKLALASSSSMPYLLKNIKDCDLEGIFDYVISGDMFKQSKPHPEIYNTCLDYFGISPKEALIVEDSPYGIEAGVNANVEVIAIKDYRFGLDQSKANYYVDDIIEVLNYIEKDE